MKLTEVRIAKSNYYNNLFEEVKSTRMYWKLIKKEIETSNCWSIVGIRNKEGALVINDKGKAEILNKHFATVRENLASCLPMSESIQSNILSRVTPTVMLSHSKLQ